MTGRNKYHQSWLSVCALLVLAACAPTHTGPLTDEAPFAPLTGDALARTCESYRIGDGGTLEWTGADGDTSRLPPYRLDCPDGSLAAFDGSILTVRTASLDESLKRFAEASSLLVYYADLKVRLEGELINADSPMTLPEALQSDLNAARITVTQNGQTRTLLAGGVVTPVAVDPTQPYTVRIENRLLIVPWPVVTVNGGEITASTSP